MATSSQIVLGFIIHTIVTTITFHGVLCLAIQTSCAAPRFDVFSEQIVASWGVSNSDIQKVEEVMRSCGGAVQGIREIEFLNNDEDNEKGPYLNRANDGFVFFDCGSYVSSSPNLSSDSDSRILGSLAFPNSLDSNLKSRIVFSGTLNADMVIPERVTRLFRVPFSGTLSMDRTDFRIENANANEIPNKILWTKQEMCSMPSKGQPWSLQRAKWSKSVRDTKEENSMDGHSNVSSNINTVAWMIATSSSKMKPMFDDNFFPTCSEHSTAVSIGALCSSTRMARALTRTYDSSGMLESVALQEGILQ